MLIQVSPRFPRHRPLAKAVSARLPEAELAHDHLHIERVYIWALRLAGEAQADADLAGAAALVHDCVTVPKDSADRHLGSQRSAELAAGLLPEAGYAAAEVAAVVEAVRTASWSRGLAPSGPLGVVLQDADRLDALGCIGLLRSACCAAEMAPRTGGQLYHAGDPAALGDRPLNDRLAMLDHLPAKLLHLAAGFHLSSARSEGQRRHKRLLRLRQELLAELAGIHPLPEPRYDSLLLDFDGTLVDSAPAIVSCLRHGAAAVGLHVGPDDAPLRALIGRPLRESLSSWGLSESDLDHAFDAYRDAWLGGERDRCVLFPGVRSCLELLRQQGIALILASAKDQQRLPEAVERMGIGDCLDACCGAMPGELDKRALVGRALALNRGQRPAMVGDRRFDGEAAKAHGCDFIAACYGYGSMEELSNCQPAALLGHPADLLACVQSP